MTHDEAIAARVREAVANAPPILLKRLEENRKKWEAKQAKLAVVAPVSQRKGWLKRSSPTPKA